ncbi:PocR ligand-binding domain-containing protein [Geomonas sp. RF6]|uniref:PocR ligand-binding domain-containing protein n=1 Tax=Geomonas sp. RF6 TaxID=2897342 RepID=UPI001E375978|nr:PocR ligand-binding domain-containing protein [Geomonas sp. RF6]UFS70933.1 PocR ligand-binding domain-containing protein [Geomonas sp. RF6]
MKRVAFHELVEIAEVRRMLEAHQQLTGTVSAIVDTDGNILVAAGWQDVCTRFHRANPRTAWRCQQSDAYLKEHLGTGSEEYLDYRCLNGLRDVAMPIVISGEHLATFFTGQFFYEDEKPDEDFFRQQAREFAFDEEEYLDAVRRAPVFTREQVSHTMRYFRSLVHLLANMGLKNLHLAQEVQERQHAEAALRRTETVLRSIFDTIPDQLSLIDREYRTIHSNRPGRLERADRGEADQCHDFYFGIGEPCNNCHVAKAFETGERVVTEKRNPRMGHIEVRAYPVFDESGEVATVVEHIRDINERRRIDEALRESEQRLRTTIHGSAIPIFVVGSDRKVIHWNRALEQLTGISEADVVGTDRAWSAFHDTERPLLADLLATGKSDEISRWYGTFCDKSKLIAEAYESTGFSTKVPGGGKWLHFTAAALRDTRGKLIGAIETIEDITERKEAEEKWRSLYNNLPGGSYTVNENRIIEDVNDLVCTITGFSRDELVGKPCGVICSNAQGGCHFLDHGVEHLDNKEILLRGKDGRYIPIIKSARRIVTGKRLMVVENFQDITEQKRLEEQLRHSQKMEAIGQMAGGVAHDFNNILTVILGNANLLQMKTEENEPLLRHLDQIVKSAEKATHLTHSLLAFSRKHVVRLTAGSVNDIVRKAENLLSRLIPEDIELRFVTGGDFQVKADSVQIEQVIMNLVTNARDAMPAGGMITVGTDEVELDPDAARMKGMVEGGRYVRISVSDNGIGIPADLHQRIFEPFFTTKETGKGTGLGLSIVYGIVKQHNGYIDVHSEPGKGTVMEVCLPSVAETVPRQERTESEPPRGHETVLLAEDEPMVRELTRSILEASGYRVLEAVDGLDALEKFQADGDKIHLLLFDVIMPRMNGKKAYDEIRKVRPDVAALFMSGYTGDFLSSKRGIDEDFNFISKPLTRSTLLHKVREVLETGTPVPAKA